MNITKRRRPLNRGTILFQYIQYNKVHSFKIMIARLDTKKLDINAESSYSADKLLSSV